MGKLLNKYLFRIDLGIQPGVSDQVDNPPFGFFWCHVQLLGQHVDGDTLVNTTESLEDKQTCILNEIIQACDQKEIVQQDLVKRNRAKNVKSNASFFTISF